MSAIEAIDEPTQPVPIVRDQLQTVAPIRGQLVDAPHRHPLLLGLERETLRARARREDVEGARDVRREQKRADEMFHRYMRLKNARAAYDEIDNVWAEYKKAKASAKAERDEHEQRREFQHRRRQIKAVCVLGTAALSLHFLPLGVCIVGAGGVIASGLWRLHSLGVYEQGRHARRNKPRPMVPTPSLELVTELPFEVPTYEEPAEDPLQLLRDVLSTQEEGERKTFTGVVLQRLQDPDQFGDTYVDWSIRNLSDHLKALGAKPTKARIGSDSRSTIWFQGITPKGSSSIATALKRAEAMHQPTNYEGELS